MQIYTRNSAEKIDCAKATFVASYEIYAEFVRRSYSFANKAVRNSN